MSPSDIRARTDRTLVRFILDGNEIAQSELVRRYRKQMEKVVHGMVGNRQTAQDLVQEAFDKAFRKLDTFRPDAGLGPWLLKIATNTARDFLRRKELETVPVETDAAYDSADPLKHPFLQIADTEITPHRQVVAKEMGQAIQNAIQALPPRLRTCVLLHVVQDRSYDSIAEVMDLPADTVQKYMRRAKTMLKEALYGTAGFTNPPNSKPITDSGEE